MASLHLPHNFYIVDRTPYPFEREVVYPFAWDEVIAQKVGEGTLPPLLHIWRHPQAFVLGLRDRRLPNALEAINQLEADGLSVTVRNSGGAAVPLDNGVLNLSLICPNPKGRIDFNQDFELMFRLIQGVLDRLGIQATKGEIQGSYCPGDYDLSVHGRKFCGIAQRRKSTAYIVQAFIVVTDEGSQRASLAHQFYDIAAQGPNEKLSVTLDSMVSLTEIAGIGFDVFREALIGFLTEKGGEIVPVRDFECYEVEVGENAAQFKVRYEGRDVL